MQLDSQEFPALMERVRASSGDAARELVDRYGDHILRIVRHKLHKKLRSKFDSDDFVQAVWTSFFALPVEEMRFEHPEALAAFLMQLARNKVIDAVRQRLQTGRYDVNRERPLDGSQAPEVGNLPGREPTASQVAMAREEWQRYLETQPAQHQQVLMSLHRGRSTQEIARELNVSLRTIYRVLRQMNKKPRRPS